MPDRRMGAARETTPTKERLTALWGPGQTARASPSDFDAFLEDLLEDARRCKASHIHLECFHTRAVIRYRIGLDMNMRCELCSSSHPKLIAAVKRRFGLDLHESRRPQIGIDRCQREHVEVNIVPATHGQCAVLKLETRQSAKTLAELGADAAQVAKLQRMLRHATGMIVVTGHTFGSKRDLAHALLRHAASSDKKAIAIEWDTNRQVPGVLQCTYTPRDPTDEPMSRLITAALRQEPDVLFVDDPRDKEAMRAIMHGAIRQCLVIVAVSRSIWHLDWYFPYLGVSTEWMQMVMIGGVDCSSAPAICPHCRAYYTPHPMELQELGIHTYAPEHLRFAYGKGCVHCNRSGYRDAEPIIEIVEVTPEMRRLFVSETESKEVRAQAIANCLTTLRIDAIRRLLEGRISSAHALTFRSAFHDADRTLLVDTLFPTIGQERT